MKEKSFLSKAYFLYFSILVGLVVLRALACMGALSFLGEAGDFVFSLIIQVGFLFCLSVFGFSRLTKQKEKDVLKAYNFQKISKKTVFLCVLIGIIVYFLNSYIASFFYFLMSLFGYSSLASQGVMTEYSVGLLILNLIFTAVLPAVCEETAHRGMLLSQMKKGGAWKAIMLSSVFFGLLHLNIYQFFYATILGVFLAVLTLSTKSIYPAMIVHFMNNALNVYLYFASVNNLFSAKLVNLVFALGSGSTVLGGLYVFLLLAFLLLSLYFLYVEVCRDSAKRSVKELQENLGRFLARKIYFDELSDVKNNLPLKREREISLGELEAFLKQDATEAKTVDRKDFGSKLFFFGILSISVLCTLFTFVWGII